jgi:hypothetical protein
MIIFVFFATITRKYGVWCKNKFNLWFCAKDSPTCGVMCYFLGDAGYSTDSWMLLVFFIFFFNPKYIA